LFIFAIQNFLIWEEEIKKQKEERFLKGLSESIAQSKVLETQLKNLHNCPTYKVINLIGVG
jgi:hypothetical protein